MHTTMDTPQALAAGAEGGAALMPNLPLPLPPPLQWALGMALPTVLAAKGDFLALQDTATGRYVYVNEPMAAFMHRPAAEAIGRTDAELFDPAVATVLRAAGNTALAQGAPLFSEHRLEWRGARHEFGVARWLLPSQGDTPDWLCSVWRDLASERRLQGQLRTALEQLEQQQQANEALRRELAGQAMRDPSSGLSSRAHFEDQLRREVDLSVREHREFALVFVEIDPVSDKVRALGQAGLHQVHEAMGRLLRGGTRAMDASCRFDEVRFAVLLSGVGLATAHSRMESLRRKCATQIVMHSGQELGFSVAMGVASFPHTAQSQEGLVQACEAALAEAQRRGGNHVALAAIRFELSR